MTDPAALAAYNDFRRQNPDLFVNRPDTAFEIVTDHQIQRQVGVGIMYRDGYSVLLRDAVRFRDGNVGPYTRVVPAAGQGGAAILPVVDGRIVLIRHERHATREKHWEIPRGFANSGELPMETARREIAEELGVSSPELYDIGSMHPDTGASGGHTRLYLARLPRVGQVESEEGIDDVIMVTPGDFDAMVRSEQITDSFTLAAALQARARGLLS
jgi:ADP-ribose pyrophosphatase